MIWCFNQEMFRVTKLQMARYDLFLLQMLRVSRTISLCVHVAQFPSIFPLHNLKGFLCLGSCMIAFENTLRKRPNVKEYRSNTACFLVLTFFVTQVRIQKDSEVRLKIVGTRVDATEIVSCLTFVA